MCLHNSKCVKYGEEHACDCADATTNFSSHFAGESCEYQSTDMCTIGNPGPATPRSFCVNRGTCKEKVTATQPHPGCNCPEGYTGPHCELRVSSSSNNAPPQTPNTPPANPQDQELLDAAAKEVKTTIAVLVVSILALVASVAISVITCMRNRRFREAREQDEARANLVARTPDSQHRLNNIAAGEPEVFMGPPTDEDGHELHNVEII